MEANQNFKAAVLPGNINNPLDLAALMLWIEAARAALKVGAA